MSDGARGRAARAGAWPSARSHVPGDAALDAAVDALVAAAGRHRSSGSCSSARAAPAPRASTPGAPTTCSWSSRPTGPSTRRCGSAGLVRRPAVAAGAREPHPAAHAGVAALRGAGRPRQGLRDRRARVRARDRRRAAATTSASGGSSSRRSCSTRATPPRARRSWPRSSRRCARPGAGCGRGCRRVRRRGLRPRRRSRPRCAGRCGPSRRAAPSSSGRRSAPLQLPVLEALLAELGRAGRARRQLAGQARAPGRPPDRPTALERFAPLGLLPPLDRARDRALAQAHGELRGLARLHRAEGEPPQRPGDRAHRARAALPAALPLGPRLPPPRLGPQGRRGRTDDPVARWCSRSCSGRRSLSMPVFALLRRGRPDRRRGQEGLELPARGSATSSCTG